MTCYEFADFLKNNEGSDIYNEKIKPRIKEAVIASIKAGKDTLTNRKNTIEIYGYDFMVDD